MNRRARPFIAMLIGIAAGFAVLGATQQPAAASFGSLEPGDFLLTVGSANVRHVRPGAVDESAPDGASPTFTPPSSMPMPSNQYGLCLDAANNIYVTNYEQNTVSKLGPNGNIISAPWVTFSGASTHPTSCTVDSSGNVYVGMGSSMSGSPRVIKFDAASAQVDSYILDPSIDLSSEIWIDLMHSNECVMAYSAGDNLIREWNVCNNTALTPVFESPINGTSQCHGVRWTPIDHLLAACESHVAKWNPSDPPSSGRIKTIAPPGIGIYDNPGPGTFYDVDTDPSGAGDTFWVTSANPSSPAMTNEVLHFNYSDPTPIGGVTVAVNPAVRGIAIVQSCGCPTASLSASPTSGSAPLDVTFSPSATAPAGFQNWTLDFGDGSSVTGAGPPPAVGDAIWRHTYTAAGTFTATFTVTDVNADSASAPATIDVSEPGAPVVTLTADPGGGQVPLEVRLFGTAKVDPTATVASWHLDYDDPLATTNPTQTNNVANAEVRDDGHTRDVPGPLTTPLADHNYEHASIHRPTLTVLDSNGRSGHAHTFILLSNPSATSGPSFTPSGGAASPVFVGPSSAPFIGGSSTPFFPQTFANFAQPTFPPFTTQVTWAPTTNTWAPASAPAASPPAPAPAATPPPAAPESLPAPAVPPPSPPRTATPPSGPAPATVLPPPPPPAVLPLDVIASPVVARNLLLSLDRNSAEPGSDVTATGEGCDANSPVSLELEGRQVGSSAADGAGHFRAPLDLKNTAIGDYDVLAHCGPTLQTRLAVTQTQKLDQPLSSILMLLFVLLGGAVVVRSALGVG